jgi:hypothetical protein
MKNFDLDFKPKDYYEKNIKKEDLLTPKDIEEFVENAVVIAGIDFGDGPYLPTIAHLMTCFFEGKYHYKLVVDDNEHVYKMKHKESVEPLTFRQVIDNIDSAILTYQDETDYEELPVGVMESQLVNNFSPDLKKEEVLKSFDIGSNFYPLEEYYKAKKETWFKHLINDDKDVINEKFNNAKRLLFDDFIENQISNFEKEQSWAQPGMYKKLVKSKDEENTILTKISNGESKTCEFKESLSLDVRQSENNKSYVPKKEEKIELSVLKTIAGFLNSDGGELFIGVNDESIICGIENELKRFHKSSKDKMQLHLKSLIKQNIGLGSSNYINLELKKVNDKEIIHVICKKSDEPVYIKDKDFYIRTGPATDKLEGRELVNYTTSRFKG